MAPAERVRRMPMLVERERLLAARWTRPWARRLIRPELWRRSRRTVRLGAAIGVFSGFILPLGQIPLAVVLAAIFRANISIAAVATLITNPITFPSIYFAAHRVGSTLLAWDGWGPSHAPAGALAQVTASALPIVTGLSVFAIVGAAVGFLLADLIWRARVHARWRRRRDRAAA
jgi:uncharacterized protein (DUF2062 family)